MAAPGIKRRVPADANQVPGLRKAAVHFAETHTSQSSDTLAAIALAVTEACTNVVRHAYPNGSGYITLTMWLDEEHLVATIADHGIGLDTARPTSGLGLGLHLIHTLAQAHITTNHHGTHVELRFPAS